MKRYRSAPITVNGLSSASGTEDSPHLDAPTDDGRTPAPPICPMAVRSRERPRCLSQLCPPTGVTINEAALASGFGSGAAATAQMGIATHNQPTMLQRAPRPDRTASLTSTARTRPRLWALGCPWLPSPIGSRAYPFLARAEDGADWSATRVGSAAGIQPLRKERETASSFEWTPSLVRML